MFIDLVESLRCPSGAHDGWLVASADEVRDRHIVRGSIGCPECRREWRVEQGELDFRGTVRAAHEPVDGALRRAPAPTHEAAAVPTAAHSHERANRYAALLDLQQLHHSVVLTGEETQYADAVAELSGAIILAVNAPQGVATAHSRLRVDIALPLGVATMRGIILDSAHCTDGWVASATRALTRGGRLVVPAHVPMPAGMTQLAADDEQWVGELTVAASGLVPLRRGGAQ